MQLNTAQLIPPNPPKSNPTQFNQTPLHSTQPKPTHLNTTQLSLTLLNSIQGTSARLRSTQPNPNPALFNPTKLNFIQPSPPQRDITQLYSTQTKQHTQPNSTTQLNPSLPSSILLLLHLLFLSDTKYLLPNPPPLADSLSFPK